MHLILEKLSQSFKYPRWLQSLKISFKVILIGVPAVKDQQINSTFISTPGTLDAWHTDPAPFSEKWLRDTLRGALAPCLTGPELTPLLLLNSLWPSVNHREHTTIQQRSRQQDPALNDLYFLILLGNCPWICLLTTSLRCSFKNVLWFRFLFFSPCELAQLKTTGLP